MTTIKLKNGSGAPATSDLVQGEPALDLTNKRLYTENASGAIIEIGTSPSTIDINAGTIDGTVIGGSTAAAGTFTTITGTTITATGTVTINNDGGSSFSHSHLILDSNGASRAAGIFSHNQVNDTEWFFGNPYDTPDSFAINRQATASHNDSTSNKTNSLVTVDSSGNVGIGSTSNHAGARVVINDTPPTAFGSPMFQVGQETFTSSGYYSIGLGYTAGSYTEPPAEIAAVATSSSGGTTADIVFGTRNVTTNTAVTERMRIDSSGNVGIGTTSPTGALTISKASSDNAINLIRTGSNTANAWIWANSDKIRFGDDNSGNPNNTRMCITTDTGRVGIGTTSPASQSGFGTPLLEVRGSSGGSLLSTNSTTGLEATFVAFSTGINIASAGAATASTGNNIVFRTGSTNSDYNSTERMRIDSSGGVIFKGSLASHQTNAGVVEYSSNITSIHSYGATSGTGQMRFLTGGGGGSGTSEAMRIDSSGNLMVAKSAVNGQTLGPELRANGQINAASAGDFLNMYSTTGSAYRFYVTNAGTINATSTSIQAISDASLKENIRDLDKGLETINALQPRRFDWKNGDGNDIMGFIAQEVQSSLPELVHSTKYNESENKLAIKMGDMIPSMVKAIQELSAQVTELKAEVAALKGE